MRSRATLIAILLLLPLSLTSCSNNTADNKKINNKVAAAKKPQVNFSDIFRTKVEATVRKVNVQAALHGATIDQALFDASQKEVFGNQKNDFKILFTAPDSIQAEGTVSTSFCSGSFSLSVSHEPVFKCIDTTK